MTESYIPALEYTAEAGWQLYRYAEDPAMEDVANADPADPAEALADANPTALLESLLAEFNLST